ncbi:MAG: GNAT family protein [Planctomycetota bacterium]|nr:GNAT family protein [Planctomycetota bacterium]
MSRERSAEWEPRPAEVGLKDGRVAVLRRARPEDALAAYACNRAVVAAGVGVTRSLKELDKTEERIIEDFREWTDGVHSGAGGCMLMGWVGDELAGSGVIRRHQPSRLRHVGHIGLGIHPAYQGLGLGRGVMVGLLDWARRGPARGITRVDLNVFADNERAIALYASLGFEIEGRRRRAIRYEDGRYADDLTMGLLLEG